MKLIMENGRYVAVSTYAEKDIPKAAGFRWDPERRQWWTSIAEKAAKLSEYASDDLRTQLTAKKIAHETALESSRATSADIEIPKPEGLEYLPFQKAGIAYATSRPSTLIADEMGLGKTIQAIGVINSDTTCKNVLVICPASLKLNWKREIEKWSVTKRTVELANGGTIPMTDVVVINYDILGKHKAALLAREWDLCVIDESQYVKSGKALRTKATLEIAAKARRRIALTGTPILNRPIELFPILSLLDPQNWKSFFGFAKRYCNAQHNGYGWDFSGASHLDELQDRLRSTVMVRRLKADVLTELPAKRHQVVELADTAGCVMREQAASRQHEEQLDSLRVAAELAKADDDAEAYAAVVAQLREASQVAFTEMSAVRHETALAKVPQVADWINETLESVPKVVVFAHHLDVIESLLAAMPDGSAVTLTGEHSGEQKQAAVDRFQNDPTCRVFIGSIRASGVGFTLTAASHVIFAELDWTPGNMTQAEDRTHRIGQVNSVLVQHLVIDGSIDANMANLLVSKGAVIHQALDAESGDAVGQAIEAAVAKVEAAATKDLHRKAIDEQAAILTPEQVNLIHAGLQQLAGMCDGALKLDGCGFNKLDAQIGKSLAMCNQLSYRQAVLGRRMIMTYHRQLPADLVAAVK